MGVTDELLVNASSIVPTERGTKVAPNVGLLSEI
jgi:hypothetical protein